MSAPATSSRWLWGAVPDDIPGASASLDRLRRIGRGTARSRLVLGDLFLGKRRIDAAAVHYGRAFALNPDAAAWQAVGVARARRGAWTGAAAACEHALLAAPKEDVLLRGGKALDAIGRGRARARRLPPGGGAEAGRGRPGARGGMGGAVGGGRSILCAGLPVALAVVLGCTPKVKIESPEEPIRIEMTVTVRHEVDQDLERLFREQDALVGRLAPAPAADGQVTLEFRILSEAAQALENAKFDGSLGEQRDGYLGLVSADAPAAVQRLRAAVNASRRQSYADIAAAHAVSADAVANASGELLIGRASPGQFVRDAGGAWSRR